MSHSGQGQSGRLNPDLSVSSQDTVLQLSRGQRVTAVCLLGQHVGVRLAPFSSPCRLSLQALSVCYMSGLGQAQVVA